jgi:hypothetical protein
LQENNQQNKQPVPNEEAHIAKEWRTAGKVANRLHTGLLLKEQATALIMKRWCFLDTNAQFKAQFVEPLKEEVILKLRRRLVVRHKEVLTVSAPLPSPINAEAYIVARSCKLSRLSELF